MMKDPSGQVIKLSISDNEMKGHYGPPDVTHIGHKIIYVVLLPKC